MKYLTSRKLKEIREELTELRKKRNEISERIHEAQDMGDLSENAEYTEAKETQAFNEGRIQELEEVVKNAIIISKKSACDFVEVGCEITVQNKVGKRTFIIVGSQEADPTQGKISNESPLGRAFLGKKKNDEVMVQTPSGKIHYKIIEIK
ncbi:MAG: transcription elongation factor GreA [Candidatus Portnoybacteria bacterium RBG_13_40_8]|uniref:Transcription elongation factor GreA n=1 Tax=Candidatus Portnoybacteria bacterium RBG_13_40_8 TaxID=1801990 RepID=A0A1G2F181_9BACT|nr:MAG: transcription elongation factor GreA [Candidatus Portnoybacteria bacterium RBG_13_40_8]OGZ34544.1 MAG: transcription elongation factor GreA [Candidatus Portnoybacteria bacterium RIFCSPHIGHO2_01_FULL_39_19]